MANNVRAWSTTAASNGTADADINAAEGCPPSAVNDAERQMMAKIKNTLQTIDYLDHGYTATFATTTTFASPGDLTAIYLSRRRLKFDCGSTLYGTIASSSYVASNTTVTMVMDSGTTLSSSLSAVYVGIIAPTNVALPANFDKDAYATTAGTTTAYTAAFNPKNVALTNGVHVRVKLDQTCGATPTLAVDGLTAKTIVKPGNGAVAAGDLTANSILNLTYDSTLDKWVVEGAAVTGAIGFGLHTIDLEGRSFTPRITNGPSSYSGETGTNDVMIVGLAYDQTTSEGAQARFVMPKSWDAGTITARFRWTATTATGTVIWGAQAVALRDGVSLDTAFGTAQTVSDTLLTASFEHVSPTTSAITIGNSPAKSDTIILQVYRDIADTLAADAILLSVEIFSTIDAATDA